jgi:2,3,4,5-tetrahydropyridine-2,6-dicarboxylate N-succinyltransferase
MNLQEELELYWQDHGGDQRKYALECFERFKSRLNAGEVRAASKTAEGWQVQAWVKQAILLGFRLGVLHDYSINDHFQFFDKHTYPTKKLSLDSGVRIVPGGTTVRDGSFVAAGVTLMPPCYINVGAYVGQNTMIDSHALVGSCAQIGENVHVSAAAQIGGVLEPVGALPVIIEDNVFVGGNCGVYEGAVVSEGAVLAAGTIITGSTRVYDIALGKIHERNGDKPLIIPAGAVVVPGSRPAQTEFAKHWGISLYTPVIIKYRDDKTDRATRLEELLRI